MINKRGAIHVDWAISMGLFIVYVVVMFILIKPGYYVEHKPENLFTIIETNLNKEISTNIKEVQFIINKCNGFEVSLKDENNKYKFSKLFKEKPDGSLEKPNDPNAGYKTSGDSIKINCLKVQGGVSDHKYVAISYPKNPYNSDTSIPKYVMPPCDYVGSSSDGGDQGDCVKKVISVLDFYGYDKDYVDELKTKPFNEIAREWSFPFEQNNPATKKFRITFTELNDNGEEKSGETDKVDISDGLPPEGVDIFVKHYKAIYLNENNDRQTIKVSIYVW